MSEPSFSSAVSARVQSTWQAWSDFWFRPSDPTLLGVVRLLTGIFTFYVILAYSVDLQEFLGKEAWFDHATAEQHRKEYPFAPQSSDWLQTQRTLPPNTPDEEVYLNRWFVNPRQVAKGQPIWSIWFHVTDPTWMTVVHVGILVAIFLFTIGLGTRVTSVITWFGVISYTQRAQTSVFGMDTMMNILLIYLMIGPSGAALSVDRLIRRYWTTWRALRAHRPAPDTIPHQPLVSANFAIRLIQVHLCIIYLAAGLSKRGNAWWTGQAVWGTLANPEFSPMNWPPYLGALQFLAKNRWLWEIFMNTSALFTLIMEIGFPFLVWVRPLRWVMLIMAVMMHIGIAVFMGLNTFSLFMMAMLVAFIPPEAIYWLLRLPGRNAPKLRLAFASRVRPQARAASFIRAVDLWDQVEFATPSDDEEASRPRLTNAEGEVFTGFRLWQHLASSVRLLLPLTPLMWLLGVTGIGQAIFGDSSDSTSQPPHLENGLHRTQGEKVAR